MLTFQDVEDKSFALILGSLLLLFARPMSVQVNEMKVEGTRVGDTEVKQC